MISRCKIIKPRGSALVVAALVALAALGGCDRKPSSPPVPSAGASISGPTAASGGPPSSSFPAGIKPAPSGDQVRSASTHDGPGEGATAIGGLSAGQNASAPPKGNATQPTGGDGARADTGPAPGKQ